MPQKSLALELLRKLLNDEIKTRSKKNLVQSRSFAEMLQKSVKSYQTRSIETVAVIEELIDLAREMRHAAKRGEYLGHSEDELAFYDALEVNDSAVKILGDEILRQIARELVEAVRKNVTIDRTVKESARAKLRVIVRRLLRKHGYPPDKQEKATQTVLEQAELLCGDMGGPPPMPFSRTKTLKIFFLAQDSPRHLSGKMCRVIESKALREERSDYK